MPWMPSQPLSEECREWAKQLVLQQNVRQHTFWSPPPDNIMAADVRISFWLTGQGVRSGQLPLIRYKTHQRGQPFNTRIAFHGQHVILLARVVCDVICYV